jgi:hypothetical protein
MVKRSSGLLGVAFLVAGCSALTSFDGLEPSSGALSDAASAGGDGSTNADGAVRTTEGGAGSDGGQASDGATPASDGGAGTDSGSNGNLIDNPGFENGAGGCGSNWGNGYGQTFMRASPGRNGSMYACEVCISGSGGSYQINAVKAIPVTAGNYYAEAWLSTPEGGVATSTGIQVYFTGDGGLSGCTGSATYCQGMPFVMAAPGGDWSSSSTSFVVTGSGTVTVDLHSYAGTASSCFLVDDVALYAQ